MDTGNANGLFHNKLFLHGSKVGGKLTSVKHFFIEVYFTYISKKVIFEKKLSTTTVVYNIFTCTGICVRATKGKKVISCIARYPVFGTAQRSFHFTSWQTCSFQCYFDLSGKHSATLQLLLEYYSFRHPSLSVARCSFIQLSELWQSGMNEIANGLKWQQEDSKLGFLD